MLEKAQIQRCALPRIRGNTVNYTHTWNLATLAIGVALLLVGAGYAPDWDVPINLIIANFSYFTASWSMNVMVRR